MMQMFNKLLLVVFLILFLGMIWIGYLLFWPIEVTKPNIQPYKILNANHTVKRGEDLLYLVDACKDRDITGFIDRKFVDGIIISTPITLGTVKAGCSQTPISIQVPDKLATGTWHLELYLYYQVNPFRMEKYHFKTEDFTVIQ